MSIASPDPAALGCVGGPVWGFADCDPAAARARDGVCRDPRRADSARSRRSRRAEILAAITAAVSGYLGAGHLDTTTEPDLLAWAMSLVL